MLGKILKLIALTTLGSACAFAQSTILTGPIVDANSVTWINGTVTAVFQPSPSSSGAPVWSGGAFNVIPPTVSVDATGNFTLSLPSNNAITPSGSMWIISICPNATLNCTVTQVPLSGGTVNVSTLVATGTWTTSTAKVITSPIAKAYNFAETSGCPPVNQGGMIFNTTTNQLFVCTSTGYVALNSGGGGGGLPAGPSGVEQVANFAVNGFSGNGTIDSDIIGSLALAYTGCTTASCFFVRSPNSTDTASNLPLIPNSASFSNAVVDHEGGVNSFYSVNPAVSTVVGNTPNNNFAGGQYSSSLFTLFTKPTPPGAGQILGNTQAIVNKYTKHTAAGFSNGLTGTLFAPPAGYASNPDWAAPRGEVNQIDFYGGGIHQMTSDQMNVYAGLGDVDMHGEFQQYSGGCTAPSDECLEYSTVHQFSTGDTVGQILSITDPTHLVTGSFTQNAQTQGQGRLIVDTSRAISTSTELSAITNPTSTVAGTATLANLTMPVSTAQFHFAVECDVPTQTNGVVSVTCPVVVDSGALGTTAANGVASTANSIGNLENFGFNITAVSGANVTMLIHKSIPVGAVGCQGGMAGTAIELLNDSQDRSEFGNGLVSGQVIQVFCSPSSHVIEYAYPESSQIWSPLISGNSLERTAGLAGASGVVDGGAFSVTPVRDGAGNVTATLLGAINGVTPLQLNAIRFYSMTGCADTSFNFTGQSTPLILSAETTVLYPQVGAAGTTTGCVLKPNNSSVALYPAAEIYDVSNPITGNVDGTLITSYQPAFQVGDAIKIPVQSSAQVEGLGVQQNIAQPSFQTVSYEALLTQYSALGSAAFQGNTSPLFNTITGQGGTGIGPALVSGIGQFAEGMTLDTAPPPNGAVINVGPVSNNCQLNGTSASCPLFKHYLVLSLVDNTYRTDNDATTGFYTTSMGNIPIMKQQVTGTDTFGRFSMQNAQFDTPNGTGNFFPITQIKGLGAFPVANGPVAYDNIQNVGPTVTVNTVGVTQEIYIIAVHYTHGDTFSTSTIIFNSAATPNNTISCSIVPTGLTGTVYAFINPQFFPIGTCTSPAGSVTDTGVRITPISSAVSSFGADFFSGGFVASAIRGGYFFAPHSQANQYSAPASGISSPVDGTLSCDTAGEGNAACIFDVGITASNTATNTDMVGEVTFAAATTHVVTFTNTYLSHPECFVEPQSSTALNHFVTYTGVTSFTINFTAAFTGTASYHCVARN